MAKSKDQKAERRTTGPWNKAESRELKAEMETAENKTTDHGRRRTDDSGQRTEVRGQKGEGVEEMLTKEELAAKLKVALRTIENWQHDGFLPFLKISNVVLFHWPTVLAHLKANFSVSPRGAVRPEA